MTSEAPAVCIGLPVYNGEADLAATLDALLAQTFDDFEIVISDNASTDGTAAICARYAARDSRIRYIRQPANLGATGNFRFVLDQARSRYFMWSGADDIRSPDFLEVNVAFLDGHPDHVASTCPNRVGNGRIVRFAIKGTKAERLEAFLDNCWRSHGIFYAVMRTDVIRGCGVVGQHFLAFDWAIGLYLASRGNIHRTDAGLMVSGAAGESRRATVWRTFRSHPVSWALPFWQVSLCALRLSSGCPVSRRLGMAWRLAGLNVTGAWRQVSAEIALRRSTGGFRG